jgi:hypothetical protein
MSRKFKALSFRTTIYCPGITCPILDAEEEGDVDDEDEDGDKELDKTSE